MNTKNVSLGALVLLALTGAGVWWMNSGRDRSGGTGVRSDGSAAPQFIARRSEFAGSESCRPCHETHFNAYLETSHYHTSSLRDEGLVKGHYSDDRSVFKVRPGFTMEMKLEEGVYRQYADAEGYLPIQQDLDIVIGAGVYAQSFAGWEDTKLVRWMAHYLTPADAWTLNPGVEPEVARLLVSNRCLECHGTYFEPDPGHPAFNDKHRSVRHNRETAMFKMHCEKCHGPAQAHVDFFKNPKEGVDFTKLIVNPAKLERDRQMDVCGLCHSGVGELLAPSFTYQPGDDLSKFIRFDESELDSAGLHSNNIHTLRKSRCYQGSETMTCSTCHDSHRNERGNVKAFSQKCLQCHQPEHCPQQAQLGAAIADNCIDCHMPRQPDERFGFPIDGRNYTYDLRTHWIRKNPQPVASSGGIGESN